MSCHRLLQRGFAKLYSYKLRPDSHVPSTFDAAAGDAYALAEFVNSSACAESAKDLHYKMKGARFWVS